MLKPKTIVLILLDFCINLKKIDTNALLIVKINKKNIGNIIMKDLGIIHASVLIQIYQIKLHKIKKI